MARARRPVSDAARAQVETLASYGLTDDQIARAVETPSRTMRRLFRAELDKGRAAGLADVARTLHFMAVRRRNVTALIFLAKTRLHWRERDRIDVVPSPPPTIQTHGVLLIPAPISPEQWEALSITQQQRLVDEVAATGGAKP